MATIITLSSLDMDSGYAPISGRLFLTLSFFGCSFWLRNYMYNTAAIAMLEWSRELQIFTYVLVSDLTLNSPALIYLARHLMH